ncbi:MAG: hypothetical protein OEV64_08325 [Desulfobulbaceae bacterium]|nr:hypothetical protein [Desulfobulbaceae bacterium]
MMNREPTDITTVFLNVLLLDIKGPLEGAILFAVSMILSKLIHGATAKILRSMLSRLHHLEARHLDFIALLVSSLIPIATGMFVVKQILLPGATKNWLNGSLYSAGMVTLLLILITTTEHIHKFWIANRLAELGKVSERLSGKVADRLSKSRQSTLIILKSIIILVPCIIVCDILGLIPKEIGVSFPSLLALFSLLLAIALFASSTSEINKLVVRKKYIQSASIVPKTELPKDPDSTIKDSIAELFLEIFKNQCGVPDTSQAEFSTISSFQENNSKEISYELRVKIKDDWRSRRMSVGPLGGETGSRSRCFYVVYDSYIVVKIPPKKIVAFEDYLHLLEIEQRIVDKLRMNECIIPTVSVIFDLFSETSRHETGDPLKNEKRYVRQLSVSPKIKKYLQISGQYAFFMDLSQYFFLQNTVESMHSIKELIAEEFSRQSEIAWDILEFEHRYGIDIVPRAITMKNTCNAFEARCKNYLLQIDRMDFFDPFQVKQWFFDGLAERKNRIGHNLPQDISGQLIVIFDEVLIENLSESITFKSMVKNSLKKTEFYRNKAAMEGIIANLLNLLAHLYRAGVAMRDLKPENLLVAGDKKDYPGFLTEPSRYSIGLIDVETSVIFKTRPIDQPQMGGTPHYATPSHFFNNQTLSTTFPDLNVILHLQDWHATIAIIYKVIIGNVLFEQTVHVIPSVVNLVKEALIRNKDLSQALQNASSMFWERAGIEFKRKIADQEEFLVATIVDIPVNGARLLAHHLRRHYEALTADSVKLIKNQTLWPDKKRKTVLFKASAERIAKYKHEAFSRLHQGGTQASRQREIIELMEKLEEIKNKKRITKQYYAVMINSEPRLSALELLEIMFNIVQDGMCKKEWSNKKTMLFPEQNIPDMDSTDDATIAVLTQTTKQYHEVRQ